VIEAELEEGEVDAEAGARAEDDAALLPAEAAQGGADGLALDGAEDEGGEGEAAEGDEQRVRGPAPAGEGAAGGVTEGADEDEERRVRPCGYRR
jgi:hypothetical protein